MSSAPSPNADEASSRRNKAISSAVATSLASKLGTLALQFVSIPIAFRTLGEETFGLYATIAVSMGTLFLFQIGIGPALTHGLSRANSRDDRLLEKQYFSTSWFMLVLMTALGGIVAALVLKLVPLTFFLGQKYAGLESKLLPGLWLALGLVLLEFILSHTERAREGFLQVHINNTFGTAGNILGAIAVGVGTPFFPTIEYLIFAIFGTRALARVANTAWLFYQRPELLPKISLFKRPLAKEMLSDGLAFTVSHSLAGIVELNLCGLLVARYVGPVGVGEFQILMQMATLMQGVIIMFTTPTWPGIVDALSRNDITWIRQVMKKLWLLAAVCGFGALLGLSLLGPIILPMIYGPEFHPGLATLIPFACYFAIGSWGHINNTILVGLGMIKKAAIFTLLETLLLSIIAYIGIKLFGLPGIFGGMVIAMILVTTWMFPKMIHTKLKEYSSSSAEPSND